VFDLTDKIHSLERVILDKDKEIELLYWAMEDEKRKHLDEIDLIKQENLELKS